MLLLLGTTVTSSRPLSRVAAVTISHIRLFQRTTKTRHASSVSRDAKTNRCNNVGFWGSACDCQTPEMGSDAERLLSAQRHPKAASPFPAPYRTFRAALGKVRNWRIL